MDLSIVKQGGEARDYRKGNWTIDETMILIEAKKMDDERRMRRQGEGGERGKPAELRWKWVEDYCWKHACFRSQNQCNDKWDNLMRDFKRVREYEGRNAAETGGGGGERSYWRIEKNERKERNLPSNMLPQIYQALVAVTERKGQRGVGSSGGGGGLLIQPPGETPVVKATTATATPAIAFSQPVPAATVGGSESERSEEWSESPAKRRRRRERRSRFEEVGSAISRSASVIAEAIQSSEERGERRHREMVSLHQTRLRIEESKAEINREGLNTLADAINNLANSILAFAANTNTNTNIPTPTNQHPQSK